MNYQVQMQFLPGNSTIWVAQLTQDDPIYTYDNENDAWTQAINMQNADSTGRLYRAVQIS
jgi:hypothetical protein